MKTISVVLCAILSLTILGAPSRAADAPALAGTARQVTEGGTAVVKLRLSREVARKVTVDWRTVDGTAVAGSDYTSRSATVTFRLGEVSKRLKVPVTDDAVAEPEEHFFVRLASDRARVKLAKVKVVVADNEPGSAMGIVLDEKRAVSHTFDGAASAIDPIPGKTMETTGADGTVYTLTVPDGALDRERTVRMTPWAEVGDIGASGGSLLGVQLEPSGITFLKPLTLEITPPGGADVAAATFTYEGTGDGPYRYPIALDPDRIVFDVYHFSGYGGVFGGQEPSFEAKEAAEAQAIMAAKIEEVLRPERIRQLAGLEPDETVMDRVQAALKAYYDEALAPVMQAVLADCSTAPVHWPRLLGFAAQAGRIGMLEDEAHNVLALLGQHVRSCLAEALEPCVDQADTAQMAEIALLWRMAQMVSVEEPSPPPLHPDRACKNRLGGTLTVSVEFFYENDMTRYTEQYTATLKPSFALYGGRYDDGHGSWTVTGSVKQENLHPQHPCPVDSESTYTGGGSFFTEWHTDGFDPATERGMAMAELNHYNPFVDGAPFIRTAALGTEYRTSYEARYGECVAYETDTEVPHLFRVPRCEASQTTGWGALLGVTVLNKRGKRGIDFTCDKHWDDSTDTYTRTTTVTVTGRLMPY